MQPMSRAVLLLCGALVGSAPASVAWGAESVRVDLELVLAVDVSRSMDPEEQLLQRAGYVAAMRDPAVVEAIVTGGWGRIAVTYVEWAGTYLNDIIVPWTLIDSDRTADAFAAALDGDIAGRMRRTSISGALSFAATLFNDNGFAGLRRVIDISGDGPNNEGAPVTKVRDRLVAGGIIINGLPVMIEEADPRSFYNIPNLDIYYEDCVIGGTGSFVLPVTDIGLFATAIRQKLILEIAGRATEPALSPLPAQFSPPTPRVDCLIGEKMWERRRRLLEW